MTFLNKKKTKMYFNSSNNIVLSRRFFKNDHYLLYTISIELNQILSKQLT